MRISSTDVSYNEIYIKVNFCDDCPVLDRLYDMCISYTSGSVGYL